MSETRRAAMVGPIKLSFSGTAAEFRAWLDQLSTLVGDDAYEWALTAAVQRHPAGKGLGRG